MCAIILSRDTYKRKDGINLAGGRRFQAGLGSEHKRLYKEGQQINTLLLAQVIQVNYKYNTVDLLALQHKEVFQNSYANEGRFSARLPMEFGGRNLAGQPYGQVNPIAVGTVVLVGFINSDKDMPIVISVYNNNDVNKQLSRTRFANADPTDMTLAGEMYQKFSLYPSLTYDSIDGDGNRIVTFSGKSFIAFDTKDMQNSPMTDASYGSRYEDLGTSYYNDGELIEPMKGRAPNVLFKHQGILDDDNKPDTHNFMIHINPDGTYRTSMMDTEQDWRTMFEMTPEGKIRLRRQGDTVRLNDGFEIGELGINEEGIVYLRNGDMDLEVREDGIYSQGKLISESVNLDDIYEKLANATFEINKTNESLQILADKSEVQDGKIVNLETEITIVAGKVESKVSATEVQDMIDSSIVDMAEAIKQAQEDADRANQIISDMASDNRLTPSEKLDLLKEWDIVKNEYPTYLAQAELYEVDSTTYTAKYKALETFVTPLLEDMEATSVVDGSIMRKTFSAYYTERINLLNAITKGLKDGLEEAMKKASQASVDATQALADSAQAQIDTNNAKQLIADIASDGKLTASEKYQLKKEWDVIVKEYPTTIAQATKYKVNTDNYTAKYKALETFVTPLFANMNETSVVNGEQLRAVFSDYYAVKITLLKEITDIARDELTDYGNRITVAETKITQTSEAITLMASRVETVESNVQTNTAQLKVQADLISQKVTASEVKDAIDNAIDNMSIGGSNLFVINTQTAGLLNENNGTVGTAVDKSVVSNYIKVTARMPYVASLYGNTGTNSIIIAWYDTSKTFISGQAVADSGDFHKTYVAPENAVYARLSYKKSDTVKMKFEVGTKPTDYSPAWDDIKGDQTALEEYIKQVEEQAKQAQQEAENAKNEAENANSAIADMSNDNMLTANEKQQILLQWEEIKTEYPINLDQANKFNVSTTQYTTAYNALKSYLDPLLVDMTKTSVIIGSTMRSTFNTYYDRRTTLLNRVAELAKQVADQAKNTADKVDDDLNNIGGYNYIGFSSGDHMYPRLMIKNVGYYYIPSTTSTEFVGDMVCLKPKTATVTSVQYDVGNANASVADVGLANYRMKEVKTGQWLTASANLKVVGTGTAYLTIFTLENGSWKASYSDRVSASQGVTRVVAQRQVTDATTGILVRVDGSSITEVHFGNMQLEVGIRSTPWKKSDIDIQEDINNVADDIKDYIGARSDNLITNGFGELGNNTNIGGIFDGADRIVGKGSFRQEEANKSLLFSEHIVIDNKKVYNFDYYMHTLKGVGRSYAMICPYDVDGIRITFPSLGGRNYNSTTPVEFTKLTKPLKVGDTEVFVEDVSLWNGQAPQDYQRSIIMWGYKNSFGYTYPDGTYSQLIQMRTYDIGAVDTTANKITLNKPWEVANPNSSDGIFPVGHTLSPTSDGSTYLYLNGHVNIQVPTTYTKYSHLISGSSEFANTTIIPVETGSIQLGFLLNREATGEKSWLNGLRLRDYTDTYKLNDDVRETQENVDKAQQDANKANQSIADLSNDNLVTPNEKLDLKKEWEIIVAEKPKNDAQADKFGVSKVAYGTAYTALDTYLKPILASTTTNSAIVGQTMRDTFKAYYTARTDLLNAVATKAKDLADTAQSGVEQVKAKAEKAQADATKAQQDATKAQQDATKANQSIADLSNDNLVTPNEKLELKKEWEIIVAEKPKNDAQATKFGVSSTAYGTAYSALSTYLSPILTDLTTNSTIVGQTMRNTFTTYYSARTDLLNAVSTKAKELADQAQTDANNAGIKADNAQNSANKAQADATKAQQDANKAQESANKAQADATSAQTNATKAQAEATKANQSIADLSNDNLATPNEKLDLKKEWEIIVAEKVINDAQADKFGVSKVAYGTAYTALSNYITPILTNLATNSAIVGQTMRDTFKAYYTARTDLLNAISTKAKELADKAQSDANKAQADADNAQSSADTAQELANNAQVTANKAQADATSAQTSATKAQADANKANQSISDLSNDNLVTPNEKLDLKKEWEIIVAEKPINDTQADKFGVSKTDYGTKYTALSNYITPILASLTTNSTIVGQTMRDTFKAYYTARTNMLNAISTKAKALADQAQANAENAQTSANKAQTDANTAQANANKAQSDANKANQSIADLSNDNLVTPSEKLDLKKEWEVIVAEKVINDAQADKFGVSKTDYGTKYTALSNYITPILTNLATNSAIVGQTMRDTFKAYYTARTNLLNSISVKAKELADRAQSDANNAQNSANNAQSSANQAQADATNAQNSANKAQADATKANQSIADLSNDNLVTPNEKLDLKKEWEIIVAEKPKNDAQADKFGVNKTTYGTAYNALNTYLTPILANLTTNSAIVGQTMRDTFKTYYSARTDLLNAIASKAKDLADNAQNTADNIAVGTRNLLVGTKDFSKGKYPGNTHVTIANEKFNDNAVLKNDPTSISGVYSDMYQITTSIVPSATQYTLSFYAKADVAGVKMNCYFYNPNTSTKVETNQGYNHTATDGSAEFTLSTKWEKYWVVWTQATPPDVIKSIIIGRLSKGTSPLSPIYMSSPMMVEGNKAQTWMKAPEDVETAINGKEGAWVYSPTAPTNPAIGLVWVDSSKTPNQPKRWVGGETGWVALTPEEVKDLPWGEDGSNLADWVAQAEQKISSDAIINTVLGSEDFTGIFDKKANTEDLNNLASYDDLDAMQAEYERLLKEGIAGIDFSPYVTNTELEQLKDSFTFSVQQAGGVNMLKNSLGFSGLDFWDDDSGRNFYRKNNSVTVTNPNVKFERTADTPNGFKLTGAQDRNGTVRINNVINSNGYWTVSFWLRGSQSGTSNFQMDICDLGTTNFAVTADNDWRKVSLTVNVTNYNQSTHHFVDFQNIAWAYFFIKDFKVEKGITATDWTPAPEDAIVFDPIVTTTQNDQLAKLGFGSGFMVNQAQNAILRQTIELPEAKQGLQYALSFYMNVATFGDTTGLQCGARIYEEGVLKYTVGVTDATQGIPSDYHLYKLVFEPESPNTVIELFVTNGAQATVIISGVMYNIGNIALKWQPYPSEIYNTNVKIDINGITVKNNQTDGYTMITPQEFSGYARVNGEMERIFTLNGQVTEVKMLKAEKRITMEPISVFAMNSKETNTIGWAFVASGEISHNTVSNT